MKLKIGIDAALITLGGGLENVYSVAHPTKIQTPRMAKT